jgi:heptosyltransferase-2
LAKPSQDSAPTLLVIELWGLGDLALAVPFLRAAVKVYAVSLVAKPHAAPIIARFVPAVELVPVVAPWTAFRGKYRFHRWPWGELSRVVRRLREKNFVAGVSARPDPRDHVLLKIAGARQRYGFPRIGSWVFLNRSLLAPFHPHRAEHWASLASALGLKIDSAETARRNGRRIIIHTGAGHPSRLWPRERFESLAAALCKVGWEPELLDDSFIGIPQLLDKLNSADRFIGNDSGPGHLAALLGVPTFTIFGPQLPELFAPRHSHSKWVEGAPCPFKPCSDYCRFSEPVCLRAIDTETVRKRVISWLDA